MRVDRWIRATARGAVGLLAIAPAMALAIAVLVDRGPDGRPQVSLFPAGLLAFDPFAWTCAQNSLIFASALTAIALSVGLPIGCLLRGPSSRAGAVSRIAVSSMLAAPPACLALGLLGIGGSAVPWCAWMDPARFDRLSLEDARGWPLWLAWIWASAPGAVALVAIATAGARRRINSTRHDAARLAGAGPFSTWSSVTWPMVRPPAARAAAIIFPLALIEPGVPWILGLRRTLAYQIVEAAARTEPFPRVAVWTAMAAALSLAGRWLLRRWGGPPSADADPEASGFGRGPEVAPRTGVMLALISTLLPVGLSVLGWLPALGLARILAGGGIAQPDGAQAAPSSLADRLRRSVGPPVPQVVVRSLFLGLTVGLVVLILARLLRPGPGRRHGSTFASRLVGRLALMPPMVQGVGVLALLDLVATALRSWGGKPGLPRPLTSLAGLAPELSIGRNPWPILTAAVGLSVGLRGLAAWRRAAESRPEESRSSVDAAVLVGSSLRRARSAAAPRRGRWIGVFLLAVLLSSVNLAPALIFAPWMDDRTIAPAMLALAQGPDEARLQAVALAFLAVAGNLAGLGAARLAPAPPPEWNPDPP